MIAQERLKELLRYDPDAGEWRWKVATGRRGRIKAGSVAGSTRKDGRRDRLFP